MRVPLPRSILFEVGQLSLLVSNNACPLPSFVSLGLHAFVHRLVVALLSFGPVVAVQQAGRPGNLVVAESVHVFGVVVFVGGARAAGVWVLVLVATGVDVGGELLDLVAELVNC